MKTCAICHKEIKEDDYGLCGDCRSAVDYNPPDIQF